MTKSEISELVNKTVDEKITENLFALEKLIEDDRKDYKGSFEELGALISDVSQYSAKVGAVSAISVLIKLGLINVEDDRA